jgi:uncharacterized protein YutE (UPF0331/DUF86 family)
MVISRLHQDRIDKHLQLIQEFLLQLKELSSLPEKEFVSDKLAHAASESYLRRCLESVFDVARHILAKTYGFKELEYKKMAEALGAKGILPKDYAGTLVKMAGYRNRMVHLYHELTAGELYLILKNHLGDLDRFVIEIASFLETYKNSHDEAATEKERRDE